MSYPKDPDARRRASEFMGAWCDAILAGGAEVLLIEVNGANQLEVRARYFDPKPDCSTAPQHASFRHNIDDFERFDFDFGPLGGIKGAHMVELLKTGTSK